MATTAKPPTQVAGVVGIAPAGDSMEHASDYVRGMGRRLTRCRTMRLGTPTKDADLAKRP